MTEEKTKKPSKKSSFSIIGLFGLFCFLSGLLSALRIYNINIFPFLNVIKNQHLQIALTFSCIFAGLWIMYKKAVGLPWHIKRMLHYSKRHGK